MKTIASYLLVLAFSLASFQAKADQESASLTRTATTGAKLDAQLSKDIYRSVPFQDTYEEQEAYQAEEQYTVDIPYQDTETYYVDVPYQEQESYQDTETYYENEYRCHNETSYRQECSVERQCSRHPGDQVCEIAHECGTNARGEQICKDLKVCHSGPDREECENRNVCRNVPVTEQKCGYERVARTRTVTKWRTVTKYRQEQRTRTVTKYRQETRTRTVTKYRTVTKCCVTRYREEFDHTWNLNVQVIFPAQAALLANEKETFSVELAGTEAQPDLSLSVDNSIYGYKLARKNVQGSSGIIELALAPKYNQQTLGEKLVTKVELSGDDDDTLNELIISDRGIVPRVTTQYNFQIVEMESKKVVSQGSVSSEQAVNGSVVAKLAQALPSDVDYVVQISATRSGIVLEKTFSFTITKQVQFTRWDAEDFGTKTLKGLSLDEQKDKTLLLFQDEGAHAKLVTQYKVIILGKDGKEVSSQVLDAKDVLNSSKKASITLDAKAMEAKEDLTVQLLVQRSGKRLASPVQFQQQVVRQFLNTADLTDKKKVSGLGIEGQGSSAKLVFQDQIKDSSKVSNQYQLTITRMGGFLGLQKKVMAQIKFTQANNMQGAQFSQYLQTLGVSSSDLDSHMQSGDRIFLDLTVTRKDIQAKKTLATIKKSVELKIQ